MDPAFSLTLWGCPPSLKLRQDYRDVKVWMFFRGCKAFRIRNFSTDPIVGESSAFAQSRRNRSLSKLTAIPQVGLALSLTIQGVSAFAKATAGLPS